MLCRALATNLPRRVAGLRASPCVSAARASHSHHDFQAAPSRLDRSELYVPGTQLKLIPKAAKSAADVIVMDLEDSVAPSEKVQARKNVIQALQEVDFWTKVVAVRINACDSVFQYKDVAELIEQAGERLDLFVIPMVGNKM